MRNWYVGYVKRIIIDDCELLSQELSNGSGSPEPLLNVKGDF